jgi:hypothetical protein
VVTVGVAVGVAVAVAVAIPLAPHLLGTSAPAIPSSSSSVAAVATRSHRAA